MSTNPIFFEGKVLSILNAKSVFPLQCIKPELYIIGTHGLRSRDKYSF